MIVYTEHNQQTQHGSAHTVPECHYYVVQIFCAPSFDDKILEVVAVFGSMQMAVSRVIKLQHHRIAQVRTHEIQYDNKRPMHKIICTSNLSLSAPNSAEQ